MKGVILAAGTASRLRPLTDHTPKCLLPMGNKTILERMIENLQNVGITELIIVTGYLQDQIRAFIKKRFSELVVTFLYNKDYSTTNNIYSLWMTRDYVRDTNIFLLDSDIIFDVKILELLLRSEDTNCLAVRSDHQLGDEEMKVITSYDHRILNISKKINPAEAAGESIGIEKFSPHFIKILFQILDRKIEVEGKVNEFYESAFQEAIDLGQKISAIDVGDLRCIEIDIPEDIKRAEEIVALHFE